MKRTSSSVLGPVGIALAGVLLASAVAPWAAPPSIDGAAAQTATLVVENMTCGLCPVIVKTAIERVAGVRSVVVEFDAKTVTVVFDPGVTSIEAIAAASTNAGYPAVLRHSETRS